MAGIKKLKIERIPASDDIKPFEALINPAGYSMTSTVAFTSQTKFSGMPPPTLSLPTLILDGTGVVPSANGLRTVQEQLQQLRKVLFKVQPATKQDRQPVVVVSWGSLRFKGRAQSLEVKYTLFDPDGIPLRASVTLRLVNPQEVQEAMQKSANEQMAQQRLVAKGGTLSQQCFEAYRDPALDQQVARSNGMTSIRDLPPGTIITLPGKV